MAEAGRREQLYIVVCSILLQCIEGTSILSPPGLAPVCSGGQLELICTTTGYFLQWGFNVISGNESTVNEHIFFIQATDEASAAMPHLLVNSTTFNFSRMSARYSPVMSKLLISPVSSSLNGTVINCMDVDASQVSSTTVIVRERDSLQEIVVREQLTEFENDGVTVILEWDELNPLYSVDVTVIPEVQVNVTRSTARLTVAYNEMYNVSVIVSHLCDQNDVTIFSTVFYYPRTNAFARDIIICKNPIELGDSVRISGYTVPVVEGTMVTFHCPPGLVLEGPNSSMCMENGEWEPALYGIDCSDINMHNLCFLYHDHQLMMSVWSQSYKY